MAYLLRVVPYFVLIYACVFSIGVNAQTIPSEISEGKIAEERATVLPGCAFTQIHNTNLLRAGFKQRQEEVEKMLYQDAMRLSDQRRNEHNGKKGAAQAKSSQILTVPIIIHIIHSSTEPNPGDGPSNPTDAQILAGIEHLNQAFRNTGVYAENGHNPLSDVQSVDVEIEFCLAQRDINGNPTSGILRYSNDTYTSLNYTQEDPQMQQWVETQNGGAYPGTDYTNIWLVNEICVVSNGSEVCNIAGYAYFPGNHGAVNNGLINRASYWGGSTNSSKIHIHEMGHYLNLYHTFNGACTNGDCLTDGDKICDTPPDNRLSFSSCGSPDNSCTTDADDLSANNPFSTDVDDLYENYMDYTSTSCQNTFTQGQKDRMRAAYLGARASLMSSQACIPVLGPEASLNPILFPDQTLCDNTFSPIVEVQNNGSEAITSLVFSVTLDQVAQSNVNWSGNIPVDQTAQITLSALSFALAGSHLLEIEILDTNGSPDPFTNNNLQFQSFQYAESITNLPYCEDLESGGVSSDWVIGNPDNSIGFEVIDLSTCVDNDNYSLAFQSWAEFPSQNTEETLLTQNIDLTNASNVSLSFDVAYAVTYSNFNTILDVAISTDCGLSYSSVYNKTGNSLATLYVSASGSNDPAAFFIPDGCEDWRSETIPLDAFIGQEILIRFKAYTADVFGSVYGYYWGNNLYLDNLCLNGVSNNSGCEEGEIVLFESPIASGVYDNTGVIFATGALAESATVSFLAAESIELMPGFRVNPGTSFQASIASCESAARKLDPSYPEQENALNQEQVGPEANLNLLSKQADLQIIPNPSTGKTNFRYYLSEISAVTNLMVIDLNGQLVKHFNLSEREVGWHQTPFSADHLPNGMYIVRLQANDQVVSKKMLVFGR